MRAFAVRFERMRESKVRGELVLAVAVWAVACTPNSGGIGGGGAGLGQGEASDEAGSASQGSATDATDSSVDGTGGGSGEATMGTGSMTTMTTMPPSDSSGSETTQAGTDSSTGEPVPPAEELLERASFGGCNDPLWCYMGNIGNPAGGPMWMQECFTATLPPPFELVELEAVIRGLPFQVSTVEVHVYANNGAAGPGALLGSRDIDVASLALGTNTITLEPPIPIAGAGVCIGLAAPDAGLGGALGVAVNESFLQNDASFFRLQNGSGCNYPAWTDVIDLGPNPTGNWCIRGTIREQ